MGNETQVKRISRMEEVLEEGTRVVKELEMALDRYEAYSGNIRELEAYYTDGRWKNDFTDEEAGRISSAVKRGVLSEDAVYDFLTMRDQVLARCGRMKR